jgi:hypothetical protein
MQVESWLVVVAMHRWWGWGRLQVLAKSIFSSLLPIFRSNTKSAEKKTLMIARNSDFKGQVAL